MNLRIAGLELGGTKCIATLADAQGRIAEQHAMPTGLPEATLPALAAHVARWRKQGPLHGLGVASFGPLGLDEAAPDYGHITATAKPGWRDADVLGALSAGHDGPLGFDTDVNGAALAEARWGAARGLDDFAYVTVGTGVGVGLIVRGQPTRGLGHCELGHIRVARLAGDAWPGACPYHGACVEGLAAGPAIKARLGHDGVHALAPDDGLWDSVADALAQMCHAMVLATGPRRILVGGGVANGQPHLLARVEQALQASLAGYVPLPPLGYIVPPALGDQAGPLGAVALGLGAWQAAQASPARP
jgi:fructokinase